VVVKGMRLERRRFIKGMGRRSSRVSPLSVMTVCILEKLFLSKFKLLVILWKSMSSERDCSVQRRHQNNGRNTIAIYDRRITSKDG
jgi:hypothetical protein